MNTTFEKYLDTIDKCLKPLPTSERVDIVKEIKGSILEMESENLSTEQILTRLGKPKDLAKAYLGDLLAKENGFSWNRFLTVCAFYSLVGFSGLFVIPVLVIVAPTFILCGVASAVLGIIKLVDYLLHLNIPYVDYIGFQFGNTALSPIPVFILSLITGIILFLASRFGFCSIGGVKDAERVSSYITKYISKDLSERKNDLNAHLYYASKGLRRAELIYKGGVRSADRIGWDFENDYVKIKWGHAGDFSAVNFD